MSTEVKDAATGEIKKAVDFDALREQLGDVAEGARERYRFTWPGKREAKEEARRPIAKTMRPVKERSKNWDDTHNLYIEGDNLDALKILRETYAGRIKMIYIDPPYNTGHDFIYQDKFRKDADDYAGESGDYDEEGGRLVANPESNGRFHSDWCSMMYPRLLLARDLLDSDGVIFVSIDDNEVSNLRTLCDEIFGGGNYVTQITWEKRYTRSNNAKLFASVTEYIIAFRKSPTCEMLRESRSEKNDSIYSNPDDDPRGPWTSVLYVNPATKTQRPNLSYTLVNPFTGENVEHPTNAWKYEKETYEIHKKENRLYWGRNGENKYLRLKKFLSEMNNGVVPVNLWYYKDVGTTESATKEIESIIGKGLFVFPKPIGLVKKALDIASDKDSIILDFFSGSATTAHAVMQLNAEDGGNRKFIMVQLPEVCDEKSEAAKAGYRTICEIGEERIRRAGEKITAEVEKANEQLELGAKPKQVPDIGFRVLRIDSSNYRDVRASPNDYSQGMLDSMVDVSEAGRSPLDKLFECFPTFQLPYDSSIEVLDDPAFTNHTVYSVNGGQLVACFDADIPESVLRGMAALEPKPSYAVVAEAGLNNSQTVTNFAEIFKQAANAEQGATQVRVI